MLTAEKLGKRLTFVVIIGLIAIAGYFIGNNYQTSKAQLEDGILNKLQAIANTTASQIDGDVHNLIIKKYHAKDELKEPMSDSLTLNIYKLLKDVKTKNDLHSDIYTLFKVEEEGHDKVYLGLISGDIQYYKHPYFSHPTELLLHFDKGYKLPSYTDEHGVWLSAFAPIKDSKGQTVAVVQADEHFDVFLEKLKKRTLGNIALSLAIIVVIALMMLYFINKIVRVDKQKTGQLQRAFKTMEEQNKKISDSINYAQRIQNAIVAKETDLQKYFPESFMYYNAKDVVSGDFPWMLEKDGDIYVAVVDCTGHGVPGAMLSFIGHFLLNEINSHRTNLPPNEILDLLHDGVVKTLRQEEDGNAHDGMDIALCKIDPKNKILEYSGAHRPLYFSRNGELQELKGTRKSIGGTQYKKLNRKFENTRIELSEGDSFYFFSDGLVDQMGGDTHNKKFGSKKIREILKTTDHSSIANVSTELIENFLNWKGSTQQLDDVLLIGIKI